MMETAIPAQLSMLRVCFCGPIPKEGAIQRGGYQSCNRRTIDALRSMGCEVVEHPYPRPTRRGVGKVLQYLRGFVRLRACVIAEPRDSIFHLTALHRQFMPMEWWLMASARRRGMKVVYDIRAGGVTDQLARYGRLYRQLFAHTARTAHLILIEGVAYAATVERLTGQRPIHFPNHLRTIARPDGRATGQSSRIELIYVGRLIPTKGVEMVLRTSMALRSLGVALRLRLVGDGPAAWLQGLRQIYAADFIEWSAPLPSERVLEAFGTSHFFVFPTRHPREGHSNALTEAMMMGCVPVASDWGFSRSVVGASGLILDAAAGPEEYAAAIKAVVDRGEWLDRSHAVAKRACERFSSEQVVAMLVRRYARLWSS